MSNFSSIGFPVISHDEMEQMCALALESATTIDAAGGLYLLYQEPSGAQLWMQAEPSGSIVGLNPHFQGNTRRSVSLVNAIDNPEYVLDGGFYAWANPADPNDPETGDYPFVFDCPDYRTLGPVELPQMATIQLSVFVQEISVYQDQADFNSSSEDEMNLAPEAFIPTGLFAAEGTPPTAFGLFTGTVLGATTHTTALKNADFHALEVRTLGGDIDVVIDPHLVETRPEAGQIVKVGAWLSGRSISDLVPLANPS